MILEIDCGNTRIKWRIIKKDFGSIVHRGITFDDKEFIEMLLLFENNKNIIYCRVSSVWSLERTKRFKHTIEKVFNIEVVLAKTASHAFGVINGYKNIDLLGVDRWLAMVAAYQREKSNIVVIDVGTAITADFVCSNGRHLGGYIAPGGRLMLGSLRQKTDNLNYLKEELIEADQLNPKRTTMDGIQGGCSLMIYGFINQMLAISCSRFNKNYNFYITGGGVKHIGAAFLKEPIYCQDLVLDGLALMYPYSTRV